MLIYMKLHNKLPHYSVWDNFKNLKEYIQKNEENITYNFINSSNLNQLHKLALHAYELKKQGSKQKIED